MNIKVLLLGGIVGYLLQFVVSMVTGPLIHEGVLVEAYIQNAVFWRPELNQVPPDMAALMPRWVTVGLIASCLFAQLFLWLRPAFSGSFWIQGVKYGLVLSLVIVLAMGGWSGIFNLPDTIWIWWAIETPFYYVVAGIAYAFIGAKLAPPAGAGHDAAM